MQKIKTLRIRAFRGIRDTTFDFDRRSIVLHGENGYGKSSLVDAFEFLFKNSISHLDESKKTSTKKHAPHIHFSRNDTYVSVVTQNPDITLKRTFEEETCHPSQQRDFLENGQDANFILRRKQLLDFIIAQPAGRYEQIARVIGVSELDDIDLNLMRREDELTKEVESLKKQQETAQNDLMQLINSEGLADNQLLNALNSQLELLEQAPLESFSDIDNYKLNAIRGTKNPTQMENAAHIQNMIELVHQLVDYQDLLTYHAPLWDSLDELNQDAELVKALAFQPILDRGKHLIDELRPNTCPVCEQPIEADEILNRLDERLAFMDSARQKSEHISKLAGQLIGDLKQTILKCTELANGINTLALEVDSSPLPRYTAYLEYIIEAVDTEPVRIELDSLDNYLNTNEELEWISLAKLLLDTLQSQLDQLAITDKDQLALDAIEILSSVDELQWRIANLNQQRQIKNLTRNQISTAYNLFMDTKKQEIQNVYDILQEDIQRYYDTLHPGEEHREIKLKIDPKKRGSTEILMGFHDRTDEDPRAYQSEAHLDSLGLCTFLAFAKHFNQDFPLIILDDVVSTVDSQHRRRVGELLYTEFSEYQLLITTHDDIWFEELANYQKVLNVSHNFYNLRILSWSLADGLRLDRHKPRWEILQERLDERDKVGAAAHARRNLEWILQIMAITTRTKVPINPRGGYTVADLYDLFKSRIKKLVPQIYENNKQVFTQLELDGIFGNLLVHNNLRAENASIEEVRAFATAVKTLHGLFTCQKGQFIEYHHTAKIMKCRCDHITWNTK